MGAPDPRAVGRAIEARHTDLQKARNALPAVRAALDLHRPDETIIAGLLLHPQPAALLELVATVPPWCRNAVLLGRVVLNPGAEQRLSLRLIPSLYWRDLAAVAAAPRVPPPVRQSAEEALRDRLSDLRPGERTTLARLATAPILTLLLADHDPRVLEACLPNPRLRQDQLEAALRRTNASRSLVEAVAASSRWGSVYSIRLTLVLQPRTPLHAALKQITSLEHHDLRRVAGAKGLPPLVQAAARAVLDRGSR